MNPQAPAPTPAPIHDIVGPIPFFPYPVWMVVAAAVVVLALLGLLVWFLATRRRKPARGLSPDERALAELARLRDEAPTGDPYPFSIAVTDVLRVYLRDAHGMSATTQTSREFLETARTRQFFHDEEREALAAFLEKADLIKFARVHATATDCTELVDRAETLVRSRVQPQPEVAR